MQTGDHSLNKCSFASKRNKALNFCGIYEKLKKKQKKLFEP